MSSPVRWPAVSLQTALLETALGLLVVAGIATAASAGTAAPGDLSSVVLSETLPGFVLSAPGPKNGPVDQSNLNLFGGNGHVSATLAQDLADGDASGEYRFWVHQPLNGDGVVISAFQFNSAKKVEEFLGDIDAGYQRVAAGTFPVPALVGAFGYSAHVSASGSPSTAYVVTFAKGGIAFEVQVITASGDLTNTDAVSLATKQAVNAPGAFQNPNVPAGTSDSRRTAEIVGLSLIAVLLIVIATLVASRDGRRRRRPTNSSRTARRSGSRQRSRRSSGARRSGRSSGARRAGPSGLSGTGPAVSPLPEARPDPHRSPDQLPEVGWHADPEHLSEQAYWDGQSWVARRRWSGTAWAEVPIDR